MQATHTGSEVRQLDGGHGDFRLVSGRLLMTTLAAEAPAAAANPAFIHALIITASVPTTSSPRARSISIWCYFDHDFIYEGAFYFDLGYFDPGHLGLHVLPSHDRIGIHVFSLRAYSTSVLYYGASAFLDFLLVEIGRAHV